MKNLLLTTFCLLASYSQLFSQNSLLFLNTKTNKTIEVTQGQTLSIQYKGYNNQIYHFKNIVTEVNDSTIMLGYPTNDLPVWAQKLSKRFEPNYRVIQIKDIVSFRRMTSGRLIGKSLISSTLTIGTALVSYNLFRDAGTTAFNSILISFGLSFGMTAFNAYILPENPVNTISDNWVITVRK